MFSSGLQRHQKCTWCTYIYSGKHPYKYIFLIIKDLLCKHEDLNLTPQPSCQKPGRAANACNPSLGKQRQINPVRVYTHMHASHTCTRMCLQTPKQETAL